jgi:hypothetical protein
MPSYSALSVVNLVETTGVEPVVPFGRRIYSPLGLPIFLHLHKLGAVDGNRTRLNLIDNQVPYPEDYNGINLVLSTGIDPASPP